MLAVKDIEPAMMAHIHVGASTSPDLSCSARAPTTGSARCTTVDKALVQAIVDNPANYYVNVHTADFPAGACAANSADTRRPLRGRRLRRPHGRRAIDER